MAKDIEKVATKVTQKIMENIDEARRDSEHTEYASVDKTGVTTDNQEKITKIVATLKSYDSQRYTKLGRNLLRIQELENEIKSLKDEIKGEDKELIADLFDAEDRIYTREVDTVGFLFKLTKDPKSTETYKYKEILDELQARFTPELVAIYEQLKAKFKTVTQKSPGLSATDKAVPQESVDLNEGLWDKIKVYLSKFKDLVFKWASSYDKRLNALKASAGINETSELNVMETISTMVKRIEMLEQKLEEAGSSFSYRGTHNPNSVIADVTPDEVKIDVAIWNNNGTSDKVWAIATCRGLSIAVWGKRMGNQMSGERNWSYQFKPRGELMRKASIKQREGYDNTIISGDRVTSSYGGGVGILRFIKGVAANVFNNDELQAAILSNDDHMVTRGGAMESVETVEEGKKGEIPPQFLKHIKGKKEECDENDDDCKNDDNKVEEAKKPTEADGKKVIADYNAARQREEEEKLKKMSADERNPRFSKKK
jgi:hypothetical protein